MVRAFFFLPLQRRVSLPWWKGHWEKVGIVLIFSKCCILQLNTIRMYCTSNGNVNDLWSVIYYSKLILPCCATKLSLDPTLGMPWTVQADFFMRCLILWEEHCCSVFILCILHSSSCSSCNTFASVKSVLIVLCNGLCSSEEHYCLKMVPWVLYLFGRHYVCSCVYMCGPFLPTPTLEEA